MYLGCVLSVFCDKFYGSHNTIVVVNLSTNISQPTSISLKQINLNKITYYRYRIFLKVAFICMSTKTKLKWKSKITLTLNFNLPDAIVCYFVIFRFFNHGELRKTKYGLYSKT